MDQLSRVHIVILSFNRLDCLPRLFKDLLYPASERGATITFIDNASNNELRTFLKQQPTSINIQYILNNENYGVSKGRNLGFKNTKREFIVNLDDDAIMSVDDLYKIPETFDKLPDAGILAFRVHHGITGEAQNETHAFKTFVGNFHGAGHAIRSNLFSKIGYLDESCFFGAEELEFSMRARSIGFNTVFIPAINVQHFSIQRVGGENFKRRINWSKNYSKVLFRYLPLQIASLFAWRLLISYILNGFKVHHLKMAILPIAMSFGAVSGIKTRNLLNREAVKFYTNPNTTPDLGNVPLRTKLFRKIKNQTFTKLS